MNRLATGRIGAVRSGSGRIPLEAERKHRSFKEMIKWRKEKEQKERLIRNKVKIWTKNEMLYF